MTTYYRAFVSLVSWPVRLWQAGNDVVGRFLGYYLFAVVANILTIFGVGLVAATPNSLNWSLWLLAGLAIILINIMLFCVLAWVADFHYQEGAREGLKEGQSEGRRATVQAARDFLDGCNAYTKVTLEDGTVETQTWGQAMSESEFVTLQISAVGYLALKEEQEQEDKQKEAAGDSN